MSRAKAFGRSLTGGGASAAGIGGKVAERNAVHDAFEEAIERLAQIVFAFLPRWQGARK